MIPNEHLKEVIEYTRLNSFRAEYQKKATDEECLGIAIAHYFTWDSRIIDTMLEAMEDANFHSLREIVKKETDKYFKRDSKPEDWKESIVRE